MDNKNSDDIFSNNSSQIFINDDVKLYDIKSVSVSKILNDEKKDNKTIDNKYNFDKSVVNQVDVPGKNIDKAGEYIYDDGIDTEIEDRNKIIKLITNKKFLLVIAIIVFICVLVMLIKVFYLRGKVASYGSPDKLEIVDGLVVVAEDDTIDDNLLRKSAADNLISCINTPINVDDIPDDINNIIKEINNYYKQSGKYFAFKYKDIHTGFTVSYNENGNIFAASTIKAPKDIYIYEMASLGNISLDEELTYTGKYYNTGTGVLKNKKINTKYSVRTLVNYSTVNSDNIAHNMLMDKFGRENMLKFWRDKGTTAIFTSNGNWGVINAHDAAIYMSELYRFYIDNPEYGVELMNNFLNATTKFISSKEYKVANKSGWSGNAIHDVAIIFDDNPYIIVALSSLGETDSYSSYFNRVSDFASRLHNEYWKYKMSVCNQIKQY